jgi:hypothetical protein
VGMQYCPVATRRSIENAGNIANSQHSGSDVVFGFGVIREEDFSSDKSIVFHGCACRMTVVTADAIAPARVE